MIVPVGEYVLVMPQRTGGFTEGGIFVPEVARAQSETGWVVAVGERCSPDLRLKGRICFDYNAGWDLREDGHEYLLMPQKEIYLRLD